MEYLQHGDLQKHLAHPLSEQEAKRITTQIIEGLGFMHGNGFTHRDLKPGEFALSIQYARKTVRHATRTTIHHGLNGARWPAATDLDHGGQTFVDDPVQSSAAM
ncbi:hypothetical protein G3M48_008480 [Beauveria asiatica]|uniref:Autophagy-related protein 1 n=1 Tax=Beauveria asiatica TaxID=1069075 RepID=A0AAW0S2Y7_9HYPO